MKYEWPDLTRCCFCFPLRRGVLAFGYLNIIFSAFMIGIYSFHIHYGIERYPLVFHGSSIVAPAELCVSTYCAEIVFNAALVYGAHRKIILYIKVAYYFILSTILAIVLIQILELSNIRNSFTFFELLCLAFIGFCLQLYLFTLVRSLLMKLDRGETRSYGNTINRIVIVGERVGISKRNELDEVRF